MRFSSNRSERGERNHRGGSQPLFTAGRSGEKTLGGHTALFGTIAADGLLLHVQQSACGRAACHGGLQERHSGFLRALLMQQRPTRVLEDKANVGDNARQKLRIATYLSGPSSRSLHDSMVESVKPEVEVEAVRDSVNGLSCYDRKYLDGVGNCLEYRSRTWPEVPKRKRSRERGGW